MFKTFTISQLLKLSTWVTIAVAFLLFSSKLSVWYFTGSAALLAVTIDNIGDFLASLVAFFAIRISLRPPDENHKWGHMKAEPLASLALGTFVLGIAFFLIITSIQGLIVGTVVAFPIYVIYVLIFSLVLNGLLVIFQQWIIKHTDSTLIRADSAHYQMDFLLNFAVILAIGLQNYWAGFDSLFGLLIGVYIIRHTYRHIIKPSMKQLMDEELSSKDIDDIVTIVSNHPKALGYHDLRTRKSGSMRFIQIHVDVDKTMNITKAHNIGDDIMNDIEKIFTHAEVIVHVDPI